MEKTREKAALQTDILTKDATHRRTLTNCNPSLYHNFLSCYPITWKQGPAFGASMVHFVTQSIYFLLFICHFILCFQNAIIWIKNSNVWPVWTCCVSCKMWYRYIYKYIYKYKYIIFLVRGVGWGGGRC